MTSILEPFKITCLFACLLILAGCSSGSYILTGDAKPTTNPDDIKLYLESPQEYETIGIEEASSKVDFSSQTATNRAVKELKKQAAKIGANGILLTDTKSKSGDVVGYYSGGVFYGDASKIKTAKGIAIFVIRE